MTAPSDLHRLPFLHYNLSTSEGGFVPDYREKYAAYVKQEKGKLKPLFATGNALEIKAEERATVAVIKKLELEINEHERVSKLWIACHSFISKISWKECATSQRNYSNQDLLIDRLIRISSSEALKIDVHASKTFSVLISSKALEDFMAPEKTQLMHFTCQKQWTMADFRKEMYLLAEEGRPILIQLYKELELVQFRRILLANLQAEMRLRPLPVKLKRSKGRPPDFDLDKLYELASQVHDGWDSSIKFSKSHFVDKIMSLMEGSSDFPLVSRRPTIEGHLRKWEHWSKV